MLFRHSKVDVILLEKDKFIKQNLFWSYIGTTVGRFNDVSITTKQTFVCWTAAREWIRFENIQLWETCKAVLRGLNDILSLQYFLVAISNSLLLLLYPSCWSTVCISSLRFESARRLYGYFALKFLTNLTCIISMLHVILRFRITYSRKAYWRHS